MNNARAFTAVAGNNKRRFGLASKLFFVSLSRTEKTTTNIKYNVDNLAKFRGETVEFELAPYYIVTQYKYFGNTDKSEILLPCTIFSSKNK